MGSLASRDRICLQYGATQSQGKYTGRLKFRPRTHGSRRTTPDHERPNGGADAGGRPKMATATRGHQRPNRTHMVEPGTGTSEPEASL